MIVFFLKERFASDDHARIELISFREANSGHQALHIAVIKGNKKIVDYLLSDFKCDPHALTANGIGVMHCAA